MKICLISAFPPSGRQLNQYAFYIARELQHHTHVELTILADELADGDASADEGDTPTATTPSELASFNVIRCWKVGSVATPVRLWKMIRQIKPDIVWFNLVFSSFGTPGSPIAAFTGLTAPALSRMSGYYTHVTLHQVVEHVDFAAAGIRREKLYRLASDMATRTLLKAHSVSVLLSDYRRVLMHKYSASNVLLGTHGIFDTKSTPPNFNARGNPDVRILAFGNWGTYKRLEALMEAFPKVLEKVPNARLIVAGPNHPLKHGYWESIRDSQPKDLPIEFRGYVSRRDVPQLFASSSVLVMPYDSATGSSGPAHQACQYGVPIVCADIGDFRNMAADEDMAVSFYRRGDASDLAEKLSAILLSEDVQHVMAERNFSAGIQMTMDRVVHNYLRWFQLHQSKRRISSMDFPFPSEASERTAADATPKGNGVYAPLVGVGAPASWIEPESALQRSDRAAYEINPTLE